MEAAGNLGNLRLAIAAGAASQDEAAATASPAGTPAGAASTGSGIAGSGIAGSGSAGAAIAGKGSAAAYRGPAFMDSDMYKTLEAIAWELDRESAGGAAAEARARPGRVRSPSVTALLEQAQRPTAT